MTASRPQVFLQTALLLCALFHVRAVEPSSPDGLLPKTEIGALRFLASHTNYDGRGVVIAVLDTGVDPGAAGLQVTTDGRPKIVDLIDATGDGDVDTSTVVEPKEGKILGLSGRTLQPGTDWKNPTGKYHLGLKAGYDFFPSGLIQRLRREAREHWLEHQGPAEAQLRQQITNWRVKHLSPSEGEERELRELELRLEQFLDLDKSFEDPGPVFDCVVFHDGSSWRAVIDTDEDGNLAEEAVLTNYRAERQYSTIGKRALLNFALNIYDDGNLLSIVSEGGNHGTHVAGIAAGYLPDQPDLNGIAPGAQIVGIKNGLARMGSMESVGAIARGISAVRELHCDIISASFGEHTVRPNHGRVIDLIDELVQEDGVIFVAAAGNGGPALSTVIAPGGTSSAVIGIGAYLSPAMAERFASSSEAIPETLYQFSSRGPATDGALGVSVSAPGGAISATPPWTLGRHHEMAGTSMATPSASGAVALLLSGLKAEKRTYSPASVRRALENSARAIPGLDRFTQGHGLIQVDAAFALCQRLADAGVTEPRIDISVSSFFPPTSSSRGIYLREPGQTRHRQDFFALAKAAFPKSTDNSRKVAFEARYRIASTAPWVRSAKFLLLNHRSDPMAGAGFDLSVDPTGLAAGVHFAEVLALEEAREDLGPAFRVPITVICPEKIDPQGGEPWRTEVILRRTSVSERRFLAVPASATWATLTARSRDPGKGSSFEIATTQLMAGRLPSDGRHEHFLNLDQSRTEAIHFPVTGGRTLELTIGQKVATGTNDSHIEVNLSFHGVTPASGEVFLDGGARVARLEATAGSDPIQLEPSAALQVHRRTIHPSGFDLRQLKSERDRLPAGRQQYDLILAYSFEVQEPGSVTPRFPALAGRLYDGEFESQLWMIHDEAKRSLAVDDAWEPAPVQVQKGTYLLRFQLRHERVAWLEKLKDLPLVLDQGLSSAISMPIHAEPDAYLIGGSPYPGALLVPNETVTFFLAAPAPESLPKTVKPGDLLLGRIRYETPPCPVTYPVTFLVPPAPNPLPTKSAPPIADERSLTERLTDERRDLAIAQLDKLSGGTNGPQFDARFEELQRLYPEHPPLLLAKLRHLADEERSTNNLRQVIAYADEIIDRTDTNALRSHFGNRVQGETPAARKTHREMEMQRDRLVDALHRKALALARLGHLLSSDSTNLPTGIGAVASDLNRGAETEFEAALTELRRWVDTASEDYSEVQIHDLEVHGRFGEKLKLQRARIEAKPTDPELREQAIRILERLGWSRWAAYERQWMLRRFPKDYPLF